MEPQAARETELLQTIQTGLTQGAQAHLDKLMEKRDASPFEDVLSQQEHAELADLLDQVEALQLRRMDALIDLAELRDVGVTTLMFELEILTEESQTNK
ncbi:MAG: hypothetical protein ACPG8W_04480 [Candidatus Promineifilaceae bacterium]